MKDYGNGTPIYLQVQLFMFYSKKYTTFQKKKNGIQLWFSSISYFSTNANDTNYFIIVL